MKLKLVSAVLVCVVLVYTPVLLIGQVVKAQELPPVQTGYSSISVRVDEVHFKDLYEFVTDLNNDSLWFPGVEETVVVDEGGMFGEGKIYLQRSFFEGVALDTVVTVKDVRYPMMYYIEGVGPVASYKATYTFGPATQSAGVFTLTTEFSAPGLTEEALEGLIRLGMQNLLDYYQSTGEITLHYLYIQ